MKTFKIRVTQPLVGFYEGEIEFKAKNRQDFIKQLKTQDLEDLVKNWQHGDEYWSDGDIELHLDSIEEL